MRPCVSRAWHLSLPPLHPGPFPGTSVPQPLPPPHTPVTGDLQDKPGLPQHLSVPTQGLPHPILTCSGSQLPADIWKENEVISINKTNCLTSVRLHCCAIMEWFRCFVRHGAGGEAVLPPWKCNYSSTKIFLERLRVVRIGRGRCLWEKRPKQKTLNFASLAYSTLSIWCNSRSHYWSWRGHLVFTHWPAPSLPPQWGIFCFFFFACFHPLPLSLQVLWCHRASLFKTTLGFQISFVLSRVWLFVNLWTIAHQAPPSMGFPRQKYWGGFPFPPTRDISHPGMEPMSPVSLALKADSLPTGPSGKPL